MFLRPVGDIDARRFKPQLARNQSPCKILQEMHIKMMKSSIAIDI
jgi:hypothetical protein